VHLRHPLGSQTYAPLPNCRRFFLPLDVPANSMSWFVLLIVWWVDPTVRFLRERMDQAGCPVWPLLIRAATCSNHSGGYASREGVWSSFSFPFSLRKNQVFYVAIYVHCRYVFVFYAHCSYCGLASLPQCLEQWTMCGCSQVITFHANYEWCGLHLPNCSALVVSRYSSLAKY
jgi:hypothetical protein